MRLIVSEKNIAARRIAEILAVGKSEADKVYNTPVYRFRRDGEDWVSIGLKGHILGVDFPSRLVYDDEWTVEWEEDVRSPASVPDSLPKPPWPKPVKKPFSGDGLDLTTWKLSALPYLIWAPVGKHPSEREIIRSLRTLAKKAAEVIIATDYDREGELIGADARGIIREANPDVPVYRARFSAITKDEIERAFRELGEVSDSLAHAGEARQDIDLIWGAVLTRYLTKVKFAGVGRPRSAGRVQTPTLKLIVDREKERQAFVPEDYWVVRARFASDDEEFDASYQRERLGAAEEAQAVLDDVAEATVGRVSEVAKNRRTVKPPTPLNTTALQAAAAAEGLSPARTMNIAESLYMEGLISYPRVDNTVYPASLDLRATARVLKDVPAYAEHVTKLLSAEKLHATRGSKETTDHPPIHPTAAADPDALKPEQWKLYNLVSRRFLATLSDEAVIEATKVTLDVNGRLFVARGDVTVSPGYRAIYPYGLKKEEHLPPLAEGAEARFLGAVSEAKQTQPPARYGQGKLIQEMEKRGLGTKATRHSIIETLYERNYVEDDPIEPTCLGIAVVEALSAFAERITSPDMTAELEGQMSEIAEGRASRDEVVGHSRELLAGVMDVLLPKAPEVGEMLREAADADAKVGVCPKSGHDLLVRRSAKTKGVFVGCSGWPDCDVTYPLPQGKIEPVPEACPECGTPQVKVIQFRQKPSVICLDPACPTNHEPELDIGPCPVCVTDGRDGRLIVRRSPRTRKRFVRCTEYETCGVSYPLPQSGEIETTDETCCGAPKVVVRSARGPWKICIDPSCPEKAKRAEKAAKKRGAPKRVGSKKRKDTTSA